jgi:hypothetical protein
MRLAEVRRGALFWEMKSGRLSKVLNSWYRGFLLELAYSCVLFEHAALAGSKADKEPTLAVDTKSEVDVNCICKCLLFDDVRSSFVVLFWALYHVCEVIGVCFYAAPFFELTSRVKNLDTGFGGRYAYTVLINSGCNILFDHEVAMSWIQVAWISWHVFSSSPVSCSPAEMREKDKSKLLSKRLVGCDGPAEWAWLFNSWRPWGLGS